MSEYMQCGMAKRFHSKNHGGMANYYELQGELEKALAENERIKNRFFRTDAIVAHYRKALEEIADFAYDEPDCARIAREALQGENK